MIKVTNTLSGRKEAFSPQDNRVLMYVCGITPYEEAHLGHAMSYIVFDVIRRYLQYRGYNVKYVQNITDIDDKIINRAIAEGVSSQEIAEKYTQRFMEDMHSLNVAPADYYPRATQEIDEIIEIIRGLEEKGYAYLANGSVYFRVTALSDYGKLSHRSLEQMMAGARVEISQDKEHPMDFVLWKASKPNEPFWTSPWGAGRPGWHIECSAMAIKYLGETIDIHGGGQDLIFPHHENEIAQSESFTGQKPFARYWLHNGLLQIGSEKMSKSLGNLVTIREALSRYSADGIRLFILSSHYRSPLSFSTEALEGAERGAERLRQTRLENDAPSSFDAAPYRERFIEAMDDDFNTPQALAVLFELAKDINRAQDSGKPAVQEATCFRELASTLGLTLKEAKLSPLDAEALFEIASFFYGQFGLNPPTQNEDVEKLVQSLITLRQELRYNKKWQEADLIRTRLAGAGILLEDTPQGTIWKRQRTP